MPVLLTSFKSGAATRHHLNDDRDAACSKRMSRSMGFRRDSFNSGRKRRLPRRRQAPDLGKKRQSLDSGALAKHINEVAQHKG